jgi:hypothetical protein
LISITLSLGENFSAQPRSAAQRCWAEALRHLFHDLPQLHMILTFLKKAFPSFKPPWLPAN